MPSIVTSEQPPKISPCVAASASPADRDVRWTLPISSMLRIWTLLQSSNRNPASPRVVRASLKKSPLVEIAAPLPSIVKPRAAAEDHVGDAVVRLDEAVEEIGPTRRQRDRSSASCTHHRGHALERVIIVGNSIADGAECLGRNAAFLRRQPGRPAVGRSAPAAHPVTKFRRVTIMLCLNAQ